MDQITLVDTATNKLMIQLGTTFVSELNKNGFEVTRALLMIPFGKNTFQFIIASPYYDKNGALNAYLKLRKELDKSPLREHMTLQDFKLYSTKDPYIRALGKSIKKRVGNAFSVHQSHYGNLELFFRLA